MNIIFLNYFELNFLVNAIRQSLTVELPESVWQFGKFILVLGNQCLHFQRFAIRPLLLVELKQVKDFITLLIQKEC